MDWLPVVCWARERATKAVTRRVCAFMLAKASSAVLRVDGRKKRSARRAESSAVLYTSYADRFREANVIYLGTARAPLTVSTFK